MGDGILAGTIKTDANIPATNKELMVCKCAKKSSGHRVMTKTAFFLVPAACIALAFATAAARAETLEVGPGKTYALPSLAIAALKDGDHVLIAAGVYADCAVIAPNGVVVEGDPTGQAMLDGKACAGKAALVVTGNGVTIRNLTLSNIHVPDGNGAGIRAEGKDLTIEGVKFIGNEDGILAGANPDSTITIRDSEFVGNGFCGADCAHGVYVGQIKLLRVEHSKFFETHQGHHIKSRALRTEIVACEIADGAHGNASYLIDIPNGGSLLVRDNKLEKGPHAENHTAAIMIGAEGVKNATPEIVVSNNAFRNDGSFDTVLVVNKTPTAAELVGNKISGRARALTGLGRVADGPTPQP